MSRLVVCEDTDHGKFTRCLWGHRHRAIVSEVCVLTDLLLANYYGLHCLNLMTLGCREGFHQAHKPLPTTAQSNITPPHGREN